MWIPPISIAARAPRVFAERTMRGAGNPPVGADAPTVEDGESDGDDFIGVDDDAPDEAADLPLAHGDGEGDADGDERRGAPLSLADADATSEGGDDEGAKGCDAAGGSWEARQLFVGGIKDATREAFEAYWSRFGKLASCEIVFDQGTPKVPRGFGYVTYAEPEGEAAALRENTHEVEGITWEIKVSTKKHDRGNASGDWICQECGNNNFARRTQCNSCRKPKLKDGQSKHFVGGIGDISTEDFRTYWKDFGGVVAADAVRHPSGQARGFGFVTFATREAAAKALAAKHEYEGKTWDLKSAQPRHGEPHEVRNVSGDGRFGAGRHGNGGAMSGDWQCGQCGNVNFRWRPQCNRCGCGKHHGGAMDMNMTGGMVGGNTVGVGMVGERGGRGSGRGNTDFRDGDWICNSCGNNNFAFRRSCNKCRQPAPGRVGGQESGRGLEVGEITLPLGQMLSRVQQQRKSGGGENLAGRKRGRDDADERGGVRDVVRRRVNNATSFGGGGGSDDMSAAMMMRQQQMMMMNNMGMGGGVMSMGVNDMNVGIGVASSGQMGEQMMMQQQMFMQQQQMMMYQQQMMMQPRQQQMMMQPQQQQITMQPQQQQMMMQQGQPFVPGQSFTPQQQRGWK